MTSCEHLNVRKQNVINNRYQYIALGVYLVFGGLYRREVAYSGPRYYVGQ